MFEKIILWKNIHKDWNFPFLSILFPTSFSSSYSFASFSHLSSLPSSSSFFYFILLFTFLLILLVISWSTSFSSSSLLSSSSPSPVFICSNTKFNQHVTKKISHEIGDYHPPWWYNRHLVAIIQFGKKFQLYCQDEVFIHQDNSNFTVKWYPQKPTQTDNFKICIFVPGLGSLSTDNYVTQFIRTICGNGYYCLVITARGHETPLNTHKVWHPAIVDDTIFMVEYLSQQYPKAKIFLAGYSAGSNIVHNTLLSLYQSNIRIYGVFCCCVNWCYSTTLRRLENSGSFSGAFYSTLLSLQVKKILSNTMHHIEAHHNIDIDRVTSKIYGFDTVDDLYHVYSGLKQYCLQTKKNSYQRMRSQRCPIFLLQPLDDPLHQDSVRKNIPIEEIQDHEDFIYMETTYGSHIGFIEGNLLESHISEKCYRYPARVALMFFNVICESNNNE